MHLAWTQSTRLPVLQDANRPANSQVSPIDVHATPPTRPVVRFTLEVVLTTSECRGCRIAETPTRLEETNI